MINLFALKMDIQFQMFGSVMGSLIVLMEKAGVMNIENLYLLEFGRE